MKLRKNLCKELTTSYQLDNRIPRLQVLPCGVLVVLMHSIFETGMEIFARTKPTNRKVTINAVPLNYCYGIGSPP